RHTRLKCDWSSDVCSSDLVQIFRLLLKISVEGNTPEFRVFLEALLRRSITCLSKVKFVPCSPLCSSCWVLSVPLACSAVRGGGYPRHSDELQQGLFEMWGGCSNIFKCTPADCILDRKSG